MSSSLAVRDQLLRRVGWFAVAGMLGVSLLAPAVVSANDLHQDASNGIAWNDQSTTHECDGSEGLAAGQVLWHFVHTGTDGSDLPATVTATFTTAGALTVNGYSNGGGNAIVMYDVVTGRDTLTGASDTIVDDNLLNLSHICVGPEASQSTAPSQSAEASQSTAPSQSVEASQSTAPSESVEASQSTAPSESVEAATGTPKLTLPPTDTVSGNGPQSGGDSWRLGLMVLAGLLASLLLLVPSPKRIRR
ncbi:MAG TPA: hypothetical protein VFI28_02295 [Candidatus Limnocylindrales bacterium]|nr:hypothetical protein [Candidatus Limnocylindrales bacterium]